MKKYQEYYEQNNLSRDVLDKNRKIGFHYFIYEGVRFAVYENVFSPQIFNGNKLFTPALERAIPRDSSMLEIGSGSGITGLYLTKKGIVSDLTLTDINPDAVKNSKDNARFLEIEEKVQTFESDVFDNIPEKEYDIIYWNHPWLPEESDYRHKDNLDKGLFDPDYKYLTKYIEGLESYSHNNTRIFLGFGDFGNLQELKSICDRYGYENIQIASQKGDENGEVKFILYELKRKYK